MAGGVSALPSFAVALAEDGGVRLLVRGSTVAHLTMPGGDVRTIDASTTSTWQEALVPDASAVRLVMLTGASEPADDGELEVVLGAVRAASLDWLLDRAASPPSPRSGPRSKTVPPDDPSQVEVVDLVAPPAADVLRQLLAQQDAATPTDSDLDVDHLLGRTRHRGVEDAAVRTDPDSAPPDGPMVWTDPREPAMGGDTIDPDREARPEPSAPRFAGAFVPEGAALIDAVPGQEPPAASAPSPADTPSDEGDLDDAPTISVAVARARRQAEQAAGQPGALVQAVRCGQGHPNPPHATACRTCAQPIDPGAEIVVIPQPVVGCLVFDDGRRVQAAGPILIGRNPKPDTGDGEDATAVVLDDPDQILSRTHAVVRVLGWNVEIVDRDSTNHTFVQPPGMPMQQIRPGEPHLLAHGTRVELGELTGFTFEAGER
jgi:hypothetical protein